MEHLEISDIYDGNEKYEIFVIPSSGCSDCYELERENDAQCKVIQKQNHENNENIWETTSFTLTS